MKKGKILVVGLIALLMVVGLVLAGCDIGIKKCSENGECSTSSPNGLKICNDSSCRVVKALNENGSSVLISGCDCK